MKFEKRGYIKEYDSNGKLISKVRVGEEEAKAVTEELNLFDTEDADEWNG